MQSLNAALGAAKLSPLTIEHGSKPFTEYEISKLLEAHNLLNEIFIDDLKLIRERKDERKPRKKTNNK